MRSKFILFLIVATAILAIAVYLALTFLIGGDETAELTPGLEAGQPITSDGQPLLGLPLAVDNTTVYINPLPGSDMMLAQQQPVVPAVPAEEIPAGDPLPTATLPPVEVQIVPQEPAAPLAPAATGQGIVPGVEPIIFIDYSVTADDTLYRITEKQLTSIELMSVYGIDAQDLVPGAQLRLPVANPAYCAGSRPYVIRPGDTAASVARRFNTTAQTLQQLNNLGADYRINIAAVLCVP
jgi:LysM repeat protein